MHTVRTVLLAGAAVVAAAGVAMAAAKTADVHVLRLQLPGGGSEVIRYAGDIAPQVVVSNGSAPVDFAAPLAPLAYEPMALDLNAPFAMLARMQAEMERQSAVMLQQARAMQAATANPEQLVEFGQLPAGGQSFSFVSTASGSGVCAHSVQITSDGDGKAPKVISKTYGDCGAGAEAPNGSAAVAPAQPGGRSEAVPVKAGPGVRAAPPALAGRIGV